MNKAKNKKNNKKENRTKNTKSKKNTTRGRIQKGRNWSVNNFSFLASAYEGLWPFLYPRRLFSIHQHRTAGVVILNLRSLDDEGGTEFSKHLAVLTKIWSFSISVDSSASEPLSYVTAEANEINSSHSYCFNTLVEMQVSGFDDLESVTLVVIVIVNS